MTIDNLRIELERRLKKSLLLKTFNEEVTSLMEEKHWNEVIFTEKTGLDGTTFRRITKTSNYNFGMRIVISICIGLQVGFEMTEHLLKLRGLAFSEDRIHRAYALMIEKSLNIEECNQFLRVCKFPKEHYLGTQERTK